MLDRSLDRVSLHRDARIGEHIKEHAELHGELTHKAYERISHYHNDAAAKVKHELDRHAAILLRHKLQQHMNNPQGGEATTPPTEAELMSRLMPSTAGTNRSGWDPFVIGGVLFLLGLGTLHMWAAIYTVPENFQFMAYIFLAFNMAIMAIRCSDLVLQERNGPYARALRLAEYTISALLIGLTLVNCYLLLTGKGGHASVLDNGHVADPVHECAIELLLGLSAVFIFHLFVELAVRRMRDWRDRGKRHW